MSTAAVTGGVGDIIYSLPVMRKLHIDLLYIKENFYIDGSSMYSVLKPLMLTQGIDCLPIPGGTDFSVFPSNLIYNYDLDSWRIRPNRGTMHIIKNMHLHFRLPLYDWNKPFLTGFNVTDQGYSLIHLTPRWRDKSEVNWHEVLRKIPKPVYFIGLVEEHQDFMKYGQIEHRQTANMLEVANLVAGAHRVYCNQGCVLVISQSLGKNYWLEKKPLKTNTLFHTPNEHIL